MAADLAETAKSDGTTADGEFWYATAAKLLAPLFFAASRDGTPVIEFDLETQLTLEDRHCLLAQLAQMAEARHAAPKAALTLGGASSPGVGAKARSLSILELARTRKQLLAIVPGAEVAERLRQIAWAVEEGALSRFDRTLALNIAVKKLREGAWTRPNRMPPNWLLRTASPEICSAA